MPTERRMTQQYRSVRRISESAGGTDVSLQVYVPKDTTDCHVLVGMPLSPHINDDVSTREYKHGTFFRAAIRISSAQDPESLEELLTNTVSTWPFSKREVLIRRSAEGFEEVISDLFEVLERERQSKGKYYATFNFLIQGAKSIGKDMLDLCIGIIRMPPM